MMPSETERVSSVHLFMGLHLQEKKKDAAKKSDE
jgi:hypothetical protein